MNIVNLLLEDLNNTNLAMFLTEVELFNMTHGSGIEASTEEELVRFLPHTPQGPLTAFRLECKSCRSSSVELWRMWGNSE